MGLSLKLKTERFRIDFHRVSGKGFIHFFCPILYTDEKAPLCQGHIVNKAFSNSPAWTVQRQDVDSFYGSNFEADFVTLKYRGEEFLKKAITDKEIFGKISPKILLNDTPVDFFIANEKIPDNFTKLVLDNGDSLLTLGLKIDPKDFITKIEHNWQIGVSKDVRIPALVSLIKSAHLSLFEMIGYAYALSTGGYFVGKQILGNFFIQNQGKAKSDIVKNAFPYFREFTHMVRPLVTQLTDLKGTIYDGQLLLCKDNEGNSWGFIVFVKTANDLNAVLIPIADKPEMVAIFLDFLRNGNDELSVSQCRFEQNKWSVDKSVHKLFWPKDGILYPEELDTP